MTNNVFIEYLHYNNGAKYNLVPNLGNLDISSHCPGLKNTVLQSTENIKIQGTNIIYEYSRFSHNGQTVSSLTAYSPSIDWTLGDRSNINAICLWVTGGLVDFDIFLNKTPNILQLLNDKVIPHNELLDLLKEIIPTFGKWLDHEESLGFSWAKEPYDRRTSIIKQNFNTETIKKLIKDLSRFGDGITFFDQITNAQRIFIDPESKLKISTNIHGIYIHDEDEIISSIIKRIATNKSYFASEIDNFNNQFSDYKSQIGILNEKLNKALAINEKNNAYISTISNNQDLLNEFKQVANLIVNANNSSQQADELHKISNAITLLRQQINESKSQVFISDINEEQGSKDVWHYSLIAIVVLFIVAVLGYGVSPLFSNSKPSENFGNVIDNPALKEVLHNQKNIIDKLNRLFINENLDTEPFSDDVKNLTN